VKDNAYCTFIMTLPL